MVKQIAENLKLPEIRETIYIRDISTEEEIAHAKTLRKTEGKHVVPLPTFEIKKDFSGILLDPLQMFKSRKSGNVYLSEKSLIRPTFSYMGNFTISDTVLKEMIEMIVENVDGIYQASKIRIDQSSAGDVGVFIYIEVVIEYGFNIVKVIDTFKKLIYKEIEEYTAMNITAIDVKVKGIYVRGE